MPTDWSDIDVTPGSCSETRLPEPLRRDPPALRPGDLAMGLVQAATTAHDPWRRLLREEPALVAAQVISFRLDDEVMRFEFALEDGPDAATQHIKGLSAKLDDWLERVDRQQTKDFREAIVALDKQMGLFGRIKTLVNTQPEKLMERLTDIGVLRNADTVSKAEAKLDALNAAHRQLMHAIASLQPAAQKAFDARLVSQDMEPAVGLIIAELKMSLLVDTHLNHFGRRHTHFYYGDVIGQHRRGAAPERALLHLPSGAKYQFMPKGTGVLARLENGTKVRFETENDMAVSTAKVAATGALTFVKDMQNSLASSLGVITDMQACLEPAAAQPLRRRVFSASTDRPFEVGLDIASEMLALAEGRRVISLTLQMDRATDLPAASYPIDVERKPYPDPRIELELRSDPELVGSLGYPKQKLAIDALTPKVHEIAVARGTVPSMDMIYEVIASEILNNPRPSVTAYQLLLGRILTLALVENNPWPTGRYWSILERGILVFKNILMGQRLAQKKDADPAEIAIGDIVEAFTITDGKFAYTPADIFQKLLGDAFDVTLSTADGPIKASTTTLAQVDAADPEELQTVEKAPRSKSTKAGLKILLTLDPQLPPIAATEDPDQTSPVATIRWNQTSRACPVSFFERYVLDAVELTVGAAGLSQIAAFSDVGPLAPSQSFPPFGARPADGATFTISAPEMTTKPVSHLQLELEWGALPDGAGGFEAHYAAYPKDYAVPEPEVDVAYLAADGWKPSRAKTNPLFARDPVDDRLIPNWGVAVPIPGITFPMVAPKDAKLPKTRADIKPGAIKLTLKGAGDFGQAAYPPALVDAMRPRLLRRKPKPVPPAPYLPKVTKMQLSYVANAVIELSASNNVRPGDQVTQVTPFGRRIAFPADVHRDFGLFPKRFGQATLFVQLAGPGSKRRLGLLFDIADSGHQRIAPDAVALQWHYLTDAGWLELPETAISSDTTDALTKSGVVMLDLPEDATTPEGEMPPGGVWVAVSTTSPSFTTHPVLSEVRTNGVWAVRSAVHDFHADGQRAWRFETPKPGMNPPIEASRRAPPRPAESRTEYLARVSERLRHRKRAVTPFDIERMVLEAFPDVWLAKCLPHLTRDRPAPRPGNTTLVITRHPPDTISSNPGARLFDAGTLKKVEAFLKKHGPQDVRYEVVNPAFDRIHVRAAVRFAPFRDDGALAHQLRHHLAHTLSVWTATDTLGQFGWQLQVPTLRAQIAALDYVVAVTDFSVLHFVADDAPTYRLADTAKPRNGEDRVIRPSRPWALALSASDHAISSINQSQTIVPTPSGIGRLRVGDMLIVNQEARQ